MSAAAPVEAVNAVELTTEQLEAAYAAQTAYYADHCRRINESLELRKEWRFKPNVYRWVSSKRLGLKQGEMATAEKPHTHGCQDARYARATGRFSIPRDLLPEFYQEYEKSIANGDFLFLDEHADPNSVCPLALDLDLLLAARYFSRLNKRQLIPLAAFVHYIVTHQFFDQRENSECIVIARDAELKQNAEGNWVLKCGLHLYWPRIFLATTERLQLYWFVCRALTEWSPNGHFPIREEGAELDPFDFSTYFVQVNPDLLQRARTVEAPWTARAVTKWTQIVDKGICDKPHARLPYAYKTEPKPASEVCKCPKGSRDCSHINHVGGKICYEFAAVFDLQGMELDLYRLADQSLDLAEILDAISLRKQPPHGRASEVRLTEQQLADISRFAHRDKNPDEAPQLNSGQDFTSEERLLKSIRSDSKPAIAIQNFCLMHFRCDLQMDSFKCGSIRRVPLYMVKCKSTHCINVCGGTHKSNGSYIRITREHITRRCFSLADAARSTLGVPCSQYEIRIKTPPLMVSLLFPTDAPLVRRAKPFVEPPDNLPKEGLYSVIHSRNRQSLNRMTAAFHRPRSAGTKDFQVFTAGSVRNPPGGGAGAAGAAGSGAEEQPEPMDTQVEASAAAAASAVVPSQAASVVARPVAAAASRRRSRPEEESPSVQPPSSAASSVLPALEASDSAPAAKRPRRVRRIEEPVSESEASQPASQRNPVDALRSMADNWHNQTWSSQRE